MEVLKLIAHADADGTLRLELPLGAPGATFELVVVYQMVRPDNGDSLADAFFAATFGQETVIPGEATPVEDDHD